MAPTRAAVVPGARADYDGDRGRKRRESSVSPPFDYYYHGGLSLSPSSKGFVPSPSLPSSPASVSLSLSSSGGSSGPSGSRIFRQSFSSHPPTFPIVSPPSSSSASATTKPRNVSDSAASDSSAASDNNTCTDLDFTSGSGGDDTNTSVSSRGGDSGESAETEGTAATATTGVHGTPGRRLNHRRTGTARARKTASVASRRGIQLLDDETGLQRSPTFSTFSFSGSTAAESLSSHLATSTSSQRTTAFSSPLSSPRHSRHHSFGPATASPFSSARRSLNPSAVSTPVGEPGSPTSGVVETTVEPNLGSSGYESFNTTASRSRERRRSSLSNGSSAVRPSSNPSTVAPRPKHRARTQSTPFFSFLASYTLPSSSPASPVTEGQTTFMPTVMEHPATSPKSGTTVPSGATVERSPSKTESTSSATSAAAAREAARPSPNPPRQTRYSMPVAAVSNVNFANLDPRSNNDDTPRRAGPPPRGPSPSGFGSRSNVTLSTPTVTTASTSTSTARIRDRTTPASTPMAEMGEPTSGAPASQLEAKVVILGMQGVGKTSMVHRYTAGFFTYSPASTIGASFCIRKLSVDGCKVRLQIWDTAGQERFRSMAPMYYRGANAAIIVYDITNESSFADVENWLNELRDITTELVIHVVGSKADLAPSKRAVSLEEAQRRVDLWTSNFYDDRNTEPATAPSMERSRSGSGAGGVPLDRTKSLSFGGLGFGRGRKSTDMERSKSREAQDERPKEGRWGRVMVTEVSAKDDFGIEDLLLSLTRRLVARQAEINHQHWLRSRDSVMLQDDDSSDTPTPTGRCCV